MAKRKRVDMNRGPVKHVVGSGDLVFVDSSHSGHPSETRSCYRFESDDTTSQGGDSSPLGTPSTKLTSGGYSNLEPTVLDSRI